MNERRVVMCIYLGNLCVCVHAVCVCYVVYYYYENGLVLLGRGELVQSYYDGCWRRVR